MMTNVKFIQEKTRTKECIQSVNVLLDGLEWTRAKAGHLIPQRVFTVRLVKYCLLDKHLLPPVFINWWIGQSS